MIRGSAVLCIAAAAAHSAFAESPSRAFLDRIKPERLEAVRQQRLEWMKTRRVDPPHGVYTEYRTVVRPCAPQGESMRKAAKADGIHAILCTDGPPPNSPVDADMPILLAAPDLAAKPGGLTDVLSATGIEPPRWKRFADALSGYPDEFLGAGDQPVALEPAIAERLAGKNALESLWKPSLRNSSLRVLARDSGEIRRSIQEGRYYSARDWLCDPSGFYFWATSNLGVYNLGDSIPLQRAAQLEARAPVTATFRLYKDGALLNESTGRTMKHPVPGPGEYRLEALLTVDGELRPWIATGGSIRAENASNLALPSYQVDDTVEQIKDIAYVENGDAKQKLDLYLPKGKSGFPVFVFVHGGSWSSGDKSLYVPIGNMLAKRGIGVAIPSYRLMPANPHPAQIEDAASAWAWVAKNIADRGGDVKRLYLGGHSAGGHLAALLALDRSFLERHGVSTESIRGVAALSGVYDMRTLSMFGKSDAERKQASPVEFVHRDAPPFVITYCQWDYLYLPLQAKEFASKLRESFVAAKLVYVPGESHISEVIAMLRPGDPTTQAILDLIGPPNGAEDPRGAKSRVD